MRDGETTTEPREAARGLPQALIPPEGFTPADITPADITPADITPEARAEMEALLGALRQWMVGVEDLGPAGLEGFAPEPDGGLPEVDFHSLVSELTALRSEVRLEARATKSSRERLEQAASAYELGLERAEGRVTGAAARLESGVGGALDRVSRENDRLRGDLERALEEPAARVLESLFDALDALRRGLEASEEARRRLRWRAWLLPRALFGGLVGGYTMALARIRRVLEELEVTEISCTGEEFDPARMRSVEARPSAAAPGQVLEVVRAGFERRGKVLRAAEVCTAAPLEDPRREGVES